MYNDFNAEPDIRGLTPENQWNPIWNQVAPGYSGRNDFSSLYNPLVVEGMAPPWYRPQRYTVGYGYNDPGRWGEVMRLLGEGDASNRGYWEQALAFDRGPRADLYGFGPSESYGGAYQPPTIPQTPTTADLLRGLRPNIGGPRREGARSIEELLRDYGSQSPTRLQPYGIPPSGYGMWG